MAPYIYEWVPLDEGCFGTGAFDQIQQATQLGQAGWIEFAEVQGQFEFLFDAVDQVEEIHGIDQAGIDQVETLGGLFGIKIQRLPVLGKLGENKLFCACSQFFHGTISFRYHGDQFCRCC